QDLRQSLLAELGSSTGARRKRCQFQDLLTRHTSSPPFAVLGRVPTLGVLVSGKMAMSTKQKVTYLFFTSSSSSISGRRDFEDDDDDDSEVAERVRIEHTSTRTASRQRF